MSLLLDELLSDFSHSSLAHIGCDETYDVGQGHSAAADASMGKGQVSSGFIGEVYRLMSPGSYGVNQDLAQRLLTYMDAGSGARSIISGILIQIALPQDRARRRRGLGCRP